MSKRGGRRTDTDNADEVIFRTREIIGRLTIVHRDLRAYLGELEAELASMKEGDVTDADL